MVAPRGLALRISCAFAGAALSEWTENSFTLGKVLGSNFTAHSQGCISVGTSIEIPCTNR